MGQQEIIDWLKKARLSGDERYFAVREIEAAMKQSPGGNGGDVWRHVNKLYAWGYLEVDHERSFRRKFRVRLEKLQLEDAV